MYYEYICELDITYGHALASDGGFHRATDLKGNAAEVSAETFLWYKVTSASVSQSSSSQAQAPAITGIKCCSETVGESLSKEWVKVEKSIDSQNHLYLYYRLEEWQERPNDQQSFPIKEVRIGRNQIDFEEGMEYVPQPLVRKDTNNNEICSYICYRRLSNEDICGNKWSIHSQKEGNWIEVKDASYNRWNVGQIMKISTNEIQVHIVSWSRDKEEYISKAAFRNRIAKLGTNVHVQLSPSYPYMRKQGTVWSILAEDVQCMRAEFDSRFFDLDLEYLSHRLVPFVEKTILCLLNSNAIATLVNQLHQHILKNVVACIISSDQEKLPSSSFRCLLAILRMILNGHSSTMFFYCNYLGEFNSGKAQKLVYTSYLTSSGALSKLPAKHPCRSLFFIENVDVFLQAGGLQSILRRMENQDIPLDEVAIYCSILNQLRPCLGFDRKKNKISLRLSSNDSSFDRQSEDFFKHFLNAVYRRLRCMTHEEIRDEDNIIEHIGIVLEILYQDGRLVGNQFQGEEQTLSGHNYVDPFFAEIVEVFALDLSKMYICSPFLQQRILGITRILDIIGMSLKHVPLNKKNGLILKLGGSNSVFSKFIGIDLPQRTHVAGKCTKWLKPDYLVRWLVASATLEVLLGDEEACKNINFQSHVNLELLKRSGGIFQFVSAFDALNEKHISLIWKAAMKQIRSGRKVVLNILLSLFSYVYTKPDLVDTFGVLLSQVPLSNYDEVLICFIKDAIHCADKHLMELEGNTQKHSGLSSIVSSNSDFKREQDSLIKIIDLGCCLLWSGIVSEVEANEKNIGVMRSEYERALASTLRDIQYVQKKYSTAPLLEQHHYMNLYIKKCVKNTREGKLVDSSLSLIMSIIDPSQLSESGARGNEFSGRKLVTSKMIQDLEEQHNIISLVIHEITRYIENYFLESKYTPNRKQSDAISQILNFLVFLVSKSELTLSYPQLEGIWLCLNSKWTSQDANEVFFKWLSVLIGDPTSHLTLTAGSKIAFPENVAREIFQKMTSSLCHDSKSLNQHLPLNLSGITESTLSCLEKLFRLVNMYERRIIMEKDGGFVIESVQLTGLDAFYVIAIQSADEIVCQQAIDYLIYIHMKLGRKLVRREVWREFVEICMTKLETTANAKNTSTSSTQVRHILLLLSTFLNQAYKVENETTADPLEEVLVHVKTQDGRTSLTFRYKLKRTSTVGELRDRIARDANYPADRIRLLNENKVKLTAQGHNKFTLKKAHVFDSTLSDNKSGSNQHVVEAILLIKVESDTSAHVVGDLSGLGRGRNAWETDWEAVRNSICSNNRYLNLLFLLLSHQNGVSEEAWKVLNLLPPDKDMEKRIRSLDGCLAIDGSIQTFPQSFEWSQFLDPHSLPKLLYQMRQLPPINFSDSHPRKEVTEWLKSFLKLGGRTHLEKILLSIKKSNLEAYGDLSMMGLSKLFQLLEFFLFASSVPSSYAMNDQSSNVAPAVFDLIQIISRLGNNEEEESSQMERNKNSIFEEYKISPATYPRADLCNTGVPNYSSCEAGAVINALSFIGAYVLSASQDACKLIEYLENYGNVFIECLGVSKHSDVRRQVLKTITSLSSTENKDADSRMKWCLYFLDLLSMYEGAIIGEEYFKLYTTLLEESEDLREFSFLPACRILCNRIREFRIAHTRIPLQKSFPYADSTSIAQHSDSLLQLVMSTLLTLLKKIPDVLAGALDVPYRGRSLRKVVATTLHEEDDILREIYNKCLFPLQEDTLDKQGCDVSSVQPKCRSALTRSTAFGLLSELSKENLPGLRYLFKIMSEQHSLSPPPEAIGSSHSKGKKAMMKHIDRANEKKPFERSKYVGLKNLGCTCYLNSTVQAFFMMPDFRRDLLCLSSEKCINANQAGTLIFELQSLFAHLESTVKPYFNPKSFALALKSWNGEPIDVSIQQDASEFLTSFFQQVESEVNGAGLNQNLLNKYFGGVFSNELVAEGNRYSERFEPFHFISVPVRDRKNLIESLDAWAEGEKVSYTWEAEGSNEKSTLETHKRISIHKLPKYLIIHLKRFEFDFEMMQQIKLNDRFEFPTNLDMYSYTKEGQYFKRQDLSGAENQEKKKAPEYYQYELTGTVVHLGTANYGHYYSFLREQSERNSNDWYEFNDDVVSRFDHSNIANECFGGAEDSNSLTRNRNSFMLFYTRAQADSESRDLKQKLSLSFYGSFLVVLFRCKIIKFSKSRKDQVYQIGQRYPEIIQKQIAKENKMFWRRRYLYDDQYLIFTCELIQSCLVGATKNPLGLPRFEPLEVRLEAIQLATKFVFGTLWQGGDVTKVLEWKEPLRALYHDELDGCKWFLNAMSENPALVFELLVFNEHDDIRELMSIVLTEAISTTSHFETEDSHLPAHSSGLRHSISVQKLAEGPQLPTSFQFVFQLVTLMPRLFQAPIVHHHHYFSILLDFAQAGRNECLLLVLNGAIGVIFGLLIGRAHSQPLIRSELMRKRDVSEPSPLLDRIEFSPVLMKLLSLLLRCGKPPAIDVENPILPPNILQDFIELADTDLGVLMLDDSVRLLISRANQYTKETKPLEQIIQHLCWESQTMTQKFIKHIMEGIELNDHLEVKPFFRTLNTMLKIRDSLARERLTDSMTKLLAVMASQARYYKATETSIEMLTRLAKRHTGIVRWLQENQMSCVWIEKWLLAHRGPEGYLQLQKTSLLKPSSSSSWVGVSVTSSKLIKSVDRMIARLVPRFRGIFDPQLGLDPFYDSDENPQRLVGKRVRVKWAQDKWYEGSVESFDDKTYEHLVVYDDGDKRQYRMSEKIFYVVDNK